MSHPTIDLSMSHPTIDLSMSHPTLGLSMSHPTLGLSMSHPTLGCPCLIQLLICPCLIQLLVQPYSTALLLRVSTYCSLSVTWVNYIITPCAILVMNISIDADSNISNLIRKECVLTLISLDLGFVVKC